MRDIVQELLCSAAEQAGPKQFNTILYVTVSNIVGNMTEEFWKEFADVQPCSDQGCDCHMATQKFVAALAEVRREHERLLKLQAQMTKNPANN